MSYDARGNLTSSDAGSFTYSKLNELLSGAGTSLNYDGASRLIQYTAASTTRFYYAGASLVAELSNSNALLRRYVPGPGVDETVVWYEGSGTADRRWLLGDERGSVIAVADTGGNAIHINRYDEYGYPTAANQGRFQYTGQTWLRELGVYNYKARMYSFSLGRLMQTDPIGYGDGLNWYAYVGGDPVNRTDPSGTDACVGPCLDIPGALVTDIYVPAYSDHGFWSTYNSLPNISVNNQYITNSLYLLRPPIDPSLFTMPRPSCVPMMKCDWLPKPPPPLRPSYCSNGDFIFASRADGVGKFLTGAGTLASAIPHPATAGGGRAAAIIGGVTSTIATGYTNYNYPNIPSGTSAGLSISAAQIVKGVGFGPVGMVAAGQATDFAVGQSMSGPCD